MVLVSLATDCQDDAGTISEVSKDSDTSQDAVDTPRLGRFWATYYLVEPEVRPSTCKLVQARRVVAVRGNSEFGGF